MTPTASSWIVGGTVLSEKVWQSLSPEHQQILGETTARLSKDLLELTREDNRKAFAAMEKLGIQVTRELTETEMNEFIEKSHVARKELIGTLYSQELLSRVEGLVQEYRDQHPSPKP
jgi:TRAP-type C4-dicarboxylate transport system substrate-binding protein